MPAPNNVRPTRPSLDATDLAILQVLERHGRIPNNALAERVGIAPSTCLGRLRALIESGVVRGFHADIAPEALGRTIQAVIAVGLASHARASTAGYAAELASLPEVRNVFFVAGNYDFLVHVAMSDTESLREFVVRRLSGNPDVARTETSLVFEHLRGDG